MPFVLQLTASLLTNVAVATCRSLFRAQEHTWLTEYNQNAGHGGVVDHFEIYLVALYWSAMTMSTM